MAPSSLSSPATLRGLSLANIATNVAIVVTGGIVRLTGSGLGCPDWPTCHGDRVLPRPGAEAGWHQAVEFGNRLMTFLVLAVAVAAWLSARRAARDRPEIRRVAVLLPVGVLGQAVLGGITVLTALHPLIVAAHFLVSMGLVAAATVLHERVARWSGARPRVVSAARPHLRQAAVGLLVVAGTVLVLGTLVTASGPHAGDPGTPRLGLDVRDVARVHAAAVWLTVAGTVAVWVSAARGAAAPRVAGAARTLLLVEVAQGAVGYLQYALGVPAHLVAVHLLLASVFWVAVVRLAVLAREQPRSPTSGSRVHASATGPSTEGDTVPKLRPGRADRDAGFTFVEVLTVIIILAILALIAISTFLGQRDKAERSRAVSALRNAETFAVAIRSDAEAFSECVADYEAEAGSNAPYRWKEDASASSDGSNLAHASIDAHEISVYGPADPCDDDTPGDGWVSMAALARDDCFYNLLVPASDGRIRHRAAAQQAPDGEPYCEGSEVTTSSQAGRITFRGSDVAPSGW